MGSVQARLKTVESVWHLTVAVYVSSSDSVLEYEVVTDNDLKGHVGELWMDGFLRRGFAETGLSDLRFSLKPLFQRSDGRTQCTGFRIEAVNPASEVVHRDFSILSLDLVAQRAANRLISSGVLKAGSKYHYKVVARRKPAVPESRQNHTNGKRGLFTVMRKHEAPLMCVKAPVACLLERSRPVREENAKFPVFYAASVLDKAEQFARKGAVLEPPVETGALLVGLLGSCPESCELFALVCEVIELEAAEQSSYSLAPSGRTWQRLREQIRLLQTGREDSRYTILGQCHGHNFLPGSCTSCKSAKTCKVTSVFVSTDDRIWNNAVFDSSPYQLCHIFGSNATGEKTDALYGLEDGRLQQRGFNVIQDDYLAEYLASFRKEELTTI